MLSVKILFFAKSRDLTGCSSAILELGNQSYKGQDLVELIAERYPR
jgi:molybdopterin converting factor small subunit